LTPIESTLRSTRILHLVFLIVPFLYIAVLFQLNPLERPVTPTAVYALAFECFATIAAGSLLRARKVTASAEKLGANPQDAVALRTWRSGQIISFAFAESVVLFGFLMKVLGARWNVAGIFFAVGILLLAAWTPKLDVTLGNQQGSPS
jgi:hypothetical protein